MTDSGQLSGAQVLHNKHILPLSSVRKVIQNFEQIIGICIYLTVVAMPKILADDIYKICSISC